MHPGTKQHRFRCISKVVEQAITPDQVTRAEELFVEFLVNCLMGETVVANTSLRSDTLNDHGTKR
jgi:hypothetical protein